MPGMFDDLVPGQQVKPAGFGMFADLVPPKDDTGDFMRGAKVALGQTAPILKGVVGLAGATAENAFGEGGISTGIKNWGLKGYQEGMQKLAPLQRDTDELTTSWERAKQGDLGALVDWAQYGLGYAVGQGGEALAASLLGATAGAALAPEAAPVAAAGGAITGLVAKGAVKEAATSLIEKAVLKEANRLMAESGGKMAAEQATKEATKAIAKNIGSTSALLAYGTGQELGSIYPEAEAEALKKGETLTGSDLARIWATGLAAGGIEGLTDKLGVDAALGKVKLPGVNGRVANAALQGIGGAAVEGGTEALQTAIERYGAGQDILSDEGVKDIINSAGLGAIGGAGIGGAAGAIHGRPQQAPQAPGETPAPVLQLGNTPDPFIVFPDGTTGKRSELEAYINGLPEDQRLAARAKLLGLGEQPGTPPAASPLEPGPPELTTSLGAAPAKPSGGLNFDVSDILGAGSVDDAIKLADMATDLPALPGNRTQEKDLDFIRADADKARAKQAELDAIQQQASEQDVVSAALARAAAITAPTPMQLALQRAREALAPQAATAAPEPVTPMQAEPVAPTAPVEPAKPEPRVVPADGLFLMTRKGAERRAELTGGELVQAVRSNGKTGWAVIQPQQVTPNEQDPAAPARGTQAQAQPQAPTEAAAVAPAGGAARANLGEVAGSGIQTAGLTQEIANARPDTAGVGGRGPADLGTGGGTVVLAGNDERTEPAGAAVRGAVPGMDARDDGRGSDGALTPAQIARKRIAPKVNPEQDTLLQAVAKMGGISRDELAREFGMKPEELKATVAVGNLKGYPFRKAGGMSIDRAAEALTEAGYFDGVAPDEVRAKLEEAVYGELGGKPHLSTLGQMRRAEQLGREEADAQQAQAAADEFSEADQQELDALLATNEGLRDIQLLDDDDLPGLDMPGETNPAAIMRALGFTEQEIQDEQATQQARQSQAGPSAGQDAASQAPAPGGARSEAPETDAALSLSAPTPEDLQAKATAEAKAQAADKAEQKRLADKAKADAERGEFTLTGSDSAADVAAAAGQGGLFDSPAKEAANILDAAEVTGKERIDAIKDIKAGTITTEELKDAYPAKIEDTGEKIGGARVSELKARETDSGVDLFRLADAMDQGAEPAQNRANEQPDRPAASQQHRDAAAKLRDSINARLRAGGGTDVVLDAVAPGERDAGLRLVAQAAKRLFGREVVFVKFQGRPLFNGVVSSRTPGVVFLNVDSEKPLLSVLGHELLHEMAKSAPGVYAKLSQALDGLIKNESAYVNREAAKYADAGLSSKGVDFREELEADIVGDNFDDPAFWAELAKDQPSAFKSIAEEVMKWLNKVLTKLKLTPFRTSDFLTDVQAARAAVAQAVREFSGTEVGAVAGDDRLSVAGKTPQTETAEFKRWFGESKVVDADGKPLVMYHGTMSDFSAFDDDSIGNGNGGADWGPGFYFTDNPDAASTYAEGDGGNVMPVYLSVKNPAPRSVVDDVMDQPGAEMDSEYVRNSLEADGYDGIIIEHKGKGREIVAFRPEQIKSALGNSGAFDPENADIRFSIADRPLNATLEAADAVQRLIGLAPKAVGETGRKYTAKQREAKDRVGFGAKPPTASERIKAIWQDAGKKLAQGLADQFAPVKELSMEAYGLLRLSKGASGAFEAMLQGGKLKLTDGVYDFDESQRGGVVDRLLIPLGGEHHDFFQWVAANRAEKLLAEGRENLFTRDDIDGIKSLSSGVADFDYTIQHGVRKGQTTRDRSLIYPDALKTFNEFQNNVLDMAEQSGLIDGEARKLWQSEFYVPFYRVTEDNGVASMNIKGGVVRQQAFKQLKGGKEKLNADLLDNTLMNWAHLLDASAKNRAAKATLEAAERMGAAIPANESTARELGSAIDRKNGVVWFMDEGEKRFYLVDDPYLLTAINALEYAGMRGPVMDAMSKFKHVLTVGVTASPFFKVRNLIRDSVQVIGTSKISADFVSNIKEGWKATDPKSDEYFRLLAGGGTIHFGTMYEGAESKRVQQLVEAGVDKSTILDSPNKLKAFYKKAIKPSIDAYNELGNRGEAINRASLYKQLKAQGMSHAEASLQARDLMDFSLQGSFSSIRFLSQVVPFLNARIQGLYKLGRAAKEDPQRFAAVVGATTVASLALLAAYSDDEDWKKREEWDRDNYWWFKIGGIAYRIPKPFEVGAIATLAERSFEYAFDKEMDGKRFRERVLSLVGSNLSMNPIPQMVKPALDVYSNVDSFSGRPIESMAMQKLKAEYRFNNNTSMTARAISTAANAVTGTIGKESLSPVQVDQLLRGYFGWLGTFVVSAGDILARPSTNQPERAAPDYWKAATGGMVANLEDAPSRYVSQMYTQAREVEAAYATWRALLKSGKVEEAKEFREENAEALKRHGLLERIKKRESELSARIRQIEESTQPGDTKREMIRSLKALQDSAARQLARFN